MDEITNASEFNAGSPTETAHSLLNDEIDKIDTLTGVPSTSYS
jgi:hypothetical protein